MYDGIKIECSVRDVRTWETSLKLIGKHLEQTGEVLPLASECDLKACTFSKVPHKSGEKYILQGSLHRYARGGGENDNDFTYAEVVDTIRTLEKNYTINPEKSKVINFEFGVNVTLPPGVEAQQFQKYLVSAYTKAFEKLNQKKSAVGYIAEFNEWSIKVYDKGYLAKNGSANMLRIEIKVTRSRWLDQYGFKKGRELVINDLLNLDNIRILGDILLEKIRSLILTPREINEKKLTEKQRRTFRECRDARSWEEWDSKTRERKRAQLARIFEVVNQPNPVDVLAELVADKWRQLSETLPETPQAPPIKKATISTIIVDGIRGIISLLIWHESKEKKFVSFILVISFKGEPLPRPPCKPTLTGFTRWIDLQGRSPPYNQNKSVSYIWLN
ncbi:MAG: hypothetical protein A2W90_02500 [Bacteroidetes bacterium GWF2_42_66]|nr:MAG: hypothetical protein A2W92_16210 [Bacteroidetes bacterium GWA2_42_15]OFY01221.1 MAG: hypothetical protein A2W89_15985 [Bacteroidetes bacterium GWE2_42_39]OFY42064.1 MAG: hypothetical protein A2W90_02500 [Bacteroidetes bacterium GWF2_42_66]HBL77733.1 hypothetical protein [Prolixibacteraceae bacterium]HCB62862.1 hypothetical protein [Bacteroidales bacterium]